MITRTKLVLLLCGILSNFASFPLLAQNGSLQLIYSNRQHNILWSSDSRFLVFEDAFSSSSVYIPEQNWFEYDTATSSVSQSSIWPLLPILTSTERQALQPLTDEAGNDYWMFLSPNGQYLIYTRLVNNNIQLGLANRQNGQNINTSLGAGSISSGTDRLNALWSGDSTTFVTIQTATQSTEPEFFYHVSNFATSLSAAIIKEIGFININGQDYPVRDIYDLSADGSLVLLEARRASDERLVIWNALNPNTPTSVSALTGTDIIAAAFKPGDERKILVVNENGLIEYDRQTGNTTVLRTDTSSVFAAKALFSPSGERLALKKEYELYLVDLRSSIPPTLTATSAPSHHPAATQWPHRLLEILRWHKLR